MKKITLLTSLDEPSDEQLSDLMKEVAQEAKRKAVLSDQQLHDGSASAGCLFELGLIGLTRI